MPLIQDQRWTEDPLPQVNLGGGVAPGPSIYGGTGVPAAALGANGDFYFRADGTEAGHTIVYHKEAGAWVATAA